jgi:hypothetical protein
MARRLTVVLSICRQISICGQISICLDIGLVISICIDDETRRSVSGRRHGHGGCVYQQKRRWRRERPRR